MEKRETLFSIGGTANWCSHYGKQYERLLKKLKPDVPYDPAIPLLGIYPVEMKTRVKKICSSMFTAALFKTAKIREQPRCPLIDGWIKKMYIFIHVTYIHI